VPPHRPARRCPCIAAAHRAMTITRLFQHRRLLRKRLAGLDVETSICIVPSAARQHSHSSNLSLRCSAVMTAPTVPQKVTPFPNPGDVGGWLSCGMSIMPSGGGRRQRVEGKGRREIECLLHCMPSVAHYISARDWARTSSFSCRPRLAAQAELGRGRPRNDHHSNAVPTPISGG
jgi:hypothetical protein